MSVLWKLTASLHTVWPRYFLSSHMHYLKDGKYASEKKVKWYIQQLFKHIKILQRWKIIKRQCFSHTACQSTIAF